MLQSIALALVTVCLLHSWARIHATPRPQLPPVTVNHRAAAGTAALPQRGNMHIRVSCTNVERQTEDVVCSVEGSMPGAITGEN